MKAQCPNCQSPLHDPEAAYCSTCFEVRPPDGWPVPAAAPRRRERPKTVVESDLDLQSIVEQAQSMTPGGSPPAMNAPPPMSGPSGPPPGPPPGYGPPSTPPPGYGPPPGSGPPPYSPPPPAPRRSGGGGAAMTVVAIIGVIVLVLGCCGGGTAWFYFVGQQSDLNEPHDSSHGDNGEEETSRPTRRRRARRRSSTSSAVSGLSERVIISRIESDGWEVLNDPNRQEGFGYTSVIISVIKPPAGGAVALYDYEDLSSAKTLETTYKDNKDAAVARSGKRVISVIMPNRPELAREVLDLILDRDGAL